MEDDDAPCVVCMESLATHPSVGMPECGHMVHVHCLVSAAQYDPRCPACRTVGRHVRVRDFAAGTSSTATGPSLDSLLSWDQLDTEYVAWHEARRRYAARRRRVLRRRPDLHEIYVALRDVQRLAKRETSALDRVYQRECRVAWRTHPDVLARRESLRKLQRREATLKSSLRELDEELGPEPEDAFHHTVRGWAVV